MFRKQVSLHVSEVQPSRNVARNSIKHDGENLTLLKSVEIFAVDF